jgi:hypothetical protein
MQGSGVRDQGSGSRGEPQAPARGDSAFRVRGSGFRLFRPVRSFRLPPSTFLLVFLLLAGCSGYQIGNQSLYQVGEQANIQTVHVTMFQSKSFRRNLGEQLTEAVVKEVEKRTPYKVVADPNADSVLSGQITGDSKRLLLQDIYGDSRESEINLTVTVKWIDRRGNVLRQGTPIEVPKELTVSATSDIVPEFGRSLAASQEQAIERLARQIVSMMEAPW